MKGGETINKVKILIVDEHQVFRFGLSHLIKSHERFEVAGECETIKEALEQVIKMKPDVVLIDIHLTDGNGAEACRQIIDANPNTKVLVLTSITNDEEIFASIMAGASGYLLKHISASELISALEKVSRGESLLDSAITGKVMRKIKNLVQGGPTDDLSVQEKRILTLVSEGKTNREIGGTMGLSENTIKNYISSILSKCGFNNRAEAAVYAVKNLL